MNNDNIYKMLLGKTIHFDKLSDINESLKNIISFSNELGLEIFSLSVGREALRPQIAFKLNEHSRDILSKLIALQLPKANKTFFLSTFGNGQEGNKFITFSSNEDGQDEKFLKELLEALQEINIKKFEPSQLEISNAIISFAENIDFWRIMENENPNIRGIAFEIDTDSKKITFYNGPFENENITLDNVVEVYEEKSLRYGNPKDTSKMTDETFAKAAEIWCEGNQSLKEFLNLARLAGIRTQGCCSGHDDRKNSPPQISLILNGHPSPLVFKLAELERQNQTSDIVILRIPGSQIHFLSLEGKENGYSEEYFERLNKELREIICYKENPNIKNIVRLANYAYACPNYKECQIFIDSSSNMVNFLDLGFSIQYDVDSIKNFIENSNGCFTEGDMLTTTKELAKKRKDIIYR